MCTVARTDTGRASATIWSASRMRNRYSGMHGTHAREQGKFNNWQRESVKKLQLHLGDAFRHTSGDIYYITGMLRERDTRPSSAPNSLPAGDLAQLCMRRKRDGFSFTRTPDRVRTEIESGGLEFDSRECVKGDGIRLLIRDGMTGVEINKIW